MRSSTGSRWSNWCACRERLLTNRTRLMARDVAIGTSLLPSHERYVIVYLARALQGKPDPRCSTLDRSL